MKPLALIIFLSLVSSLSAFDLWQYPEMAYRNALFIGCFAAPLSLTEGFKTPPPEFNIDWLLPAGLPFSLGLSFRVPWPNLTSFGLRAGYHINLDAENVDLYFLYVFDFGFTRNGILARYGDAEQEIKRYDFRAGVRRRFGRFVCLSVESDWKLQNIRFGVSIKLH